MAECCKLEQVIPGVRGKEMKKLFALILILGTMLPPSPAPARADDCTGPNGLAVPYAQESVTVSTAAVILTAATYNPTSGIKPIEALITVGAANVRVWFTGTAPSDTVGHIFSSGQSFTVCAATIPRFQAIRDDAVDAVLSVTYMTLQ
jgi:hypothetical protein